ncbi:MAG: acetolactate decarboxylase [Desulfomonilaceae bacterium]
MRRLSAILLALFVIVAAFGMLYAKSAGYSISQVSTFHALKQGMYDGETTFGELKKQGDFGLGTVNGLDGEVLALNGEFFQIKADGRVYSIADAEKTPFAVVTFFKSDKRLSLPRVSDMKELQETLDRMLPSVNSLFAIRIDGDFKYVKVRSVPRQEKPYPGLEEALKHQTVFELKNVRGTLVGFRFPSYMDGVNLAGYHFHFITADRKAGGHTLDCSTEGANVEAALISNLSVSLLEEAKDASPSR